MCSCILLLISTNLDHKLVKFFKNIRLIDLSICCLSSLLKDFKAYLRIVCIELVLTVIFVILSFYFLLFTSLGEELKLLVIILYNYLFKM